MAKFIHLFRNSLLTLRLALIHEDPNVRNSITYIHGDHLYNDIVVHMTMLNEFSFWIDTTCFCNQQMENIIRSFQTSKSINIEHPFLFEYRFLDYWLEKPIAFHHDRRNYFYIMLTLPFVFDFRFMIVNDIVNMKFNRIDLHAECLTSTLFNRTPGLILLVGVNEILGESFFAMLTQGRRRSKAFFFDLCFSKSKFFFLEKSIRINLNGIYKIEDHDVKLMLFDKIELQRRYENQPSKKRNFYSIDY